MKDKVLLTFLRYASIVGNVGFILWVTFNAIDEGFKGTLPQKASYVALIGLLSINVFFLSRKTTTSN